MPSRAVTEMAEEIQVPASRRWSAMAGGTSSERLGAIGEDDIGMDSVQSKDDWSWTRSGCVAAYHASTCRAGGVTAPSVVMASLDWRRSSWQRWIRHAGTPCRNACTAAL